MKEVKLVNGIARVDVENNKRLVVSCIEGLYSMSIQGYTHQSMVASEICEDKKRISTINKYAAKYGVKFVA